MSVCWPYLSNYTIVENNGLLAPRVEEGGYEKLIFNLLALFIIFGGTKFHDYKVVPNMGCHAELIKISQLFMCVCCMFAYNGYMPIPSYSLCSDSKDSWPTLKEVGLVI